MTFLQNLNAALYDEKIETVINQGPVQEKKEVTSPELVEEKKEDVTVEEDTNQKTEKEVKEVVKETVEKKETKVKTTKEKKTPVSNKNKEKYLDEITKLTEEFGGLKSGVEIEVELQKLLKIIPKNRKRVSSYDGLVNYLKNKKGVTLTIKSKKKIKKGD